ncbi:sterol desaturase family protein [Rubrivirga sp. IMCC43871]|uniref:sterol desaturase family protein n=1 Tax=Rubrivirga sp. IMCC43871 TaxID=3391575 RepID=UPI00398FB6C4
MDLDALRQIQPAVTVAVLAALLLAETAHPFFDAFRDRSRTRHGVRNLALGAVNGLVVAVGFAGLWVAAAEWADTSGVGLLNVLGLPAWAHLVGAVLLLDLWMYAWHRLNHRVPFLWRLHRVHHSDAQMDVTTASRFHTGEIVLSSVLRVGVIAGLGVYAWELVAYETVMFVVVQLHHANVGLPDRVDRALRLVIPTPAMHKIHHSRWQPETDSNYGSLFSWWDRLFRSFRLRRDVSTVRLGLDGFDTPEHESLRGLVAVPAAPLDGPVEDERNRPPEGE